MSTGHANGKKPSTTEEAPPTTKPRPTTKQGKTEYLRVLSSRFSKASFAHSGSELIALVSPATFDVLFDPGQRTRDGDHYICYQARFKQLSAPPDPTANSDQAVPDQAPTPRVLKAGSTEMEKEVGPTEPSGTGEVYIGCSPDVIDQHIVFVALTEGVAEWDIVRFVHTQSFSDTTDGT